GPCPQAQLALANSRLWDTIAGFLYDSTQIELLREFMKLQKEMFSMDQIKDLTTSEAFLEYDTNKDGFISPKDFYRAMEAQKGWKEEYTNDENGERQMFMATVLGMVTPQEHAL
ncbi:unnamed protein product, partial [Rotaria sp. Silwood2]